MKISADCFTDSGFYRSITRRIAAKYCSLLRHRSTMVGKLDVTSVVFMEEPSDYYTTALTTVFFEDGLVQNRIALSVNPNDSPRFIAYVLAHEFGHVLETSSNDFLCLFNDSASGCHGEFSSIHRRKSGEIFGRAMEESVADNLARYVLSHCRFSDVPRGKGGMTFAQIAAPDNGYTIQCDFADKMASAFGDPLQAAACIDDFTFKTYLVDPQAPLYQLLQDTKEPFYPDSRLDILSAEKSEGETCCTCSIHNEFWYAVAAGHFEFIIDDYNDTMGSPEAYRELCRDMDKYYNLMDYLPDEDAFAAKKRADDRIAEFCTRFYAKQLRRKAGLEPIPEQSELDRMVAEYTRTHEPIEQ